MNFNIGDTMGGYEIVGVLGSGGMGEVYRVRNVISDRVDAMKVLLANLQRDDDFATRFLREIKVQARLVHPNIAQLHTAFEHDGNLMMIMELIDGHSLLEMLQHGRIPLPQVIDYTQQALTALSYAHLQGVIHRDIKPGNIMVTRSGSVKLMDFGIAKAATDRSLTITGNLIGSLYYMSPEQVKAIAIDSRSDLYSVGVVLYQMATGKKPFEGDSEYRIMRAQVEEPPPPPTSIEPSVPEELSNVILRALAKDPAERFQTGDEFREALGRVAVMLREADAGATRMLGSQGAPRPRSHEVPTAPLSEPKPSAPPPPAAPPSPAASPSTSRIEEQRAPAAPQTPVQPAPQARQTASQDAVPAPEPYEEDGERPGRSRTPLWIGIGIAAAVLIVAATQMFDWMSTGSPAPGTAGSAASVEAPVPVGQPPDSQPAPKAATPSSSEAAPATPQPAEDRSPRETASLEPQTPAPAPPSRESAPVERASNPTQSPVSTSERTPPSQTANPAPATSNPSTGRSAPVSTPPASTPPSGTASPPAAPGGLRASGGSGSSTSTPGAATKAAATPTPPRQTSPQQANIATAQTPAPAPAAPATPAPSQPADRVYLPNELDSLPEVIHRVQPRYTAAAAQVRAEGVVRLETEIWPDGTTHNIRIVQSAGHTDLDRNAVEALRKWNFVPGRKDGRSVKVRARIDFPFSLQTATQRPALTKDR